MSFQMAEPRKATSYRNPNLNILKGKLSTKKGFLMKTNSGSSISSTAVRSRVICFFGRDFAWWLLR
jgi:hypothetical protein